MFFKNYGYCHCCDSATSFSAKYDWFRDHYLCDKCGSIPRERALMYYIENSVPNWKNKIVHETSPGNRGASVKLKGYCKKYIPSQYYPNIPGGKTFQNMRSENLENLSFDDNSIDLHISQDVMEHIFDAEKAFKEIERTLKPGGKHIFTVPIVNKYNPTKITASLGNDGRIIHYTTPEYHGNPISNKGALVTRNWGFDIVDYIYKSSGMVTQIMHMDSLEFGIRAELIEVLISTKLSV